MQSRLNPYLSFKDNAKQAMEFYQTVFGGKLDLSTFESYHMAEDPAEKDKIMHSQLEADHGIIFMAADTPNRLEYKTPQGFGMSLSGDNETELSAYFDKLSEGGTITMPMEKAP